MSTLEVSRCQGMPHSRPRCCNDKRYHPSSSLVPNYPQTIDDVTDGRPHHHLGVNDLHNKSCVTIPSPSVVVSDLPYSSNILTPSARDSCEHVNDYDFSQKALTLQNRIEALLSLLIQQTSAATYQDCANMMNQNTNGIIPQQQDACFTSDFSVPVPPPPPLPTACPQRMFDINNRAKIEEANKSASTYFLKMLLGEQLTTLAFHNCAAEFELVKSRTTAEVAVSPPGHHFPGTHDRVVAVSGASEMCVLAVVDFIIDKILQLTQNDATGQTKPRCKIAIPRTVIGSLIGKTGAYIQSVRMATGAHVHVSPLFVRADEACSERLVTVSSRDRGSLRAAIFTISRKINEHTDGGSCRSVVYWKRQHQSVPDFILKLNNSLATSSNAAMGDEMREEVSNSNSVFRGGDWSPVSSSSTAESRGSPLSSHLETLEPQHQHCLPSLLPLPQHRLNAPRELGGEKVILSGGLTTDVLQNGSSFAKLSYEPKQVPSVLFNVAVQQQLQPQSRISTNNGTLRRVWECQQTDDADSSKDYLADLGNDETEESAFAPLINAIFANLQ